MIDKDYFKKKIKENKDTDKELAAYLGCTPVSFSNKMNGKQPWQGPELVKIYERYTWTPVEFISTFISKDIPNIELLLGVEKQIVEFRVEN